MSVDEIIARERNGAFGFTDDSRCLFTYGDFRRLLMEIEAAWKRETQTYLDQIRDAMNQFGHEKFKSEHAPVCNAAAMREALDAALRFIGNIEIEPYSPLDEDASELRQRIMDALSAQPRNCDVGTTEEQERRYDHYCHAHINKGNYCDDCPLSVGKEQCEFAWAQMPYEAEEGAKAR